MPPRPAFDLRQIRLADTLPLFLADGPNHLLLRHRPAQAAQRPFHLTQVSNFLCQFHISYRNIYIAICNVLSSAQFTLFSAAWRTAYRGLLDSEPVGWKYLAPRLHPRLSLPPNVSPPGRQKSRF